MIDIRFGFLFPWTFRLVALIALIGAFGIFPTYLIWSLVLFLASVFVLVASEGTEFDTRNNRYREYSVYFFLKTGTFNPCPPIEKIYITKGKESQIMHTAHTNHSSTFESTVHNGYLKFSSGEKIHLLRTKNKENLLEILAPLSEGLKVEIVDHS